MEMRLLNGDTSSIILRARFVNIHLRRFTLAARGRRGSNPPHLVSDNDWLALGQHSELATPLLDWTHSPCVTLYFALQESPHTDPPFRSIFALYSPVKKTRNSQQRLPVWVSSFTSCVHFRTKTSDLLVKPGHLHDGRQERLSRIG